MALTVTAPGHAPHARVRTAGDDATDVVLGSPAGLTGTVTAAGRAVEHALVVVLDHAGEALASTRTDAAGRYVLPSPPPGRHTLVAVAGTHGATARPVYGGLGGAEASRGLSGSTRPTTPS